MRVSRSLVSWVVCLSFALAGWAHAQSVLDQARVKQALPGKCPAVPPMMSGTSGAVPVVGAYCKVVTPPQCMGPSAYWCGVGFVPLYRSEITKSLYFLSADVS